MAPEEGEQPLHSRLKLLELLAAAVEESVSVALRLLSQVRSELQVTLREEGEAGREGEIEALQRELAQLREAMAARAVIERAKGILMQMHSLSESESFTLLNDLSQRGHRKLRDVAADIADKAPLQRLPAGCDGDPLTGSRVRPRGVSTPVSPRNGDARRPSG